MAGASRTDTPIECASLEDAMMPGFGSLGEAELSEALDQICLAEGVTRDKLMSVKIIDGTAGARETGTTRLDAAQKRGRARPVDRQP